MRFYRIEFLIRDKLEDYEAESSEMAIDELNHIFKKDLPYGMEIVKEVFIKIDEKEFEKLNATS